MNINELPPKYILKEDLLVREFEKHFSWKVSDNSTAIKTVDQTVLEEMSTGVPKDICYFFSNHHLSVSDKIRIKIYIENNIYDGYFQLLQNGRHRLSFRNIKEVLVRLNLRIGHKIWFEKIDSDKFILYATDEKFNFILSPSFTTTDSITTTDSYSITKTRVGQSIFRSRVILACHEKCVVTGLNEQPISILNASHIKSWKDSNDFERLDGENGLLLSPHLDKLFDKHLITFNENNQIIRSKLLDPLVFNKWNIHLENNYILSDGQMNYMKYHNEYFLNKENF